MDTENYRDWIGRTESRTDRVTGAPVAALAATLEVAHGGDEVPPLWHWLYFLPVHRQSELGEDGHGRRGGFLPPVSLSKRLYAGGRLEFHRALRVGAEVSRVSRIEDVSSKEGRSGPLVFVRVRHEIRDELGLAIVEEQDIVYRGEAGGAPVLKRAADDAQWSREIFPDEVLLFRYSALTFNGHRIHYDQPYATRVEGYPGLVVHGPLVATLLADLVRRNLPDSVMTHFSFRATGTLFNPEPFLVEGRLDPGGKAVALWAANGKRLVCMEARALLA
jgi:3-methylfumaryl-CoA hydratase